MIADTFLSSVYGH